jgi:ankyrin repeat protein
LIAKSNGKTALHSAARNGHLEILKALLSKEPGLVIKIDKKGQTALHMAVKGQTVELVEELIMSEPSLMNMVDNKGNSALHIAVRKGRDQVFYLFFRFSLPCIFVTKYELTLMVCSSRGLIKNHLYVISIM